MSLTTILIRVLILTAFLLLIDIYAFQAIKTVFKESNIARYIYWGFSISVLIIIWYTSFNLDARSGPNASFNLMMALAILSLVPKLIVSVLMFGEDAFRIMVGVWQKISGETGSDFLPDRRKFISQTGLILAAIPFAGIIHGVLKGKYNYRVVNKTLAFKDLPEEFENFTITQISDVHSGSFDNAEKIKYGIDLINEQESDVILFTGDLVNNRADEMDPWKGIFSELKAKHGKYSILGNHDYGDYVKWDSPIEKQRNMEKLYQTHADMGFQLLRNENVQINKSSSSIDLIGVENWGKGFAQHGDLDKASEGLKNESFKILMSHDPSHFDEVVKKFKQFIHLTLSGHTHGMQFGIEIPGFIKWSPVKYRYPKWAGLYEDLGRRLYVNRGFGFLAFPGRVGIWPEITVLKLVKEA
jgi:predicted MPP superfamily phosphohydrolase